jgi:hypothetical protein
VMPASVASVAPAAAPGCSFGGGGGGLLGLVLAAAALAAFSRRARPKN